jgi:hypothetical protein
LAVVRRYKAPCGAAATEVGGDDADRILHEHRRSILVENLPAVVHSSTLAEDRVLEDFAAGRHPSTHHTRVDARRNSMASTVAMLEDNGRPCMEAPLLDCQSSPALQVQANFLLGAPDGHNLHTVAPVYDEEDSKLTGRSPCRQVRDVDPKLADGHEVCCCC